MRIYGWKEQLIQLSEKNQIETIEFLSDKTSWIELHQMLIHFNCKKKIRIG